MKKAMIFAAGLGTRLRPLTDRIPKALVPINGKPMLQIVIEQLKQQGIQEIIINVHYLGEQIINFIQQNNQFGIKIEISDE
ncbi:MAG TPA: sugar phosphate nucleotidyltransferase, partial [Chitinophagales bacterium]|nr:sugar phosphate nucleotidyltransferase [Chitinophagales bacterium]